VLKECGSDAAVNCSEMLGSETTWYSNSYSSVHLELRCKDAGPAVGSTQAVDSAGCDRP
jgi:hypothetical protein